MAGRPVTLFCFRFKELQASSSIGRAPVSKTGCWGFESLLACQFSQNCHSGGGVHRQMSEKTEARSGSAAFEAVKWLLVVGFVAAAVVGNSYFSDQATLYRVIGVVAVSLVAVFVALQTEQGKAFNQLRKDSLVELRKIVWPTRQETLQTTLIVLVFVVIVALLLFVLDWILGGLMSWVIG